MKRILILSIAIILLFSNVGFTESNFVIQNLNDGDPLNLNVVKEEDLRRIGEMIYNDFKENYEVKLFPEGLGFRISNKLNGTQMGYATFGSITFFPMTNYEWSDKPLYFTTMHEMGHMIQTRYFTKEDFKRYCEIRNMNADIFIENFYEIKEKYPHLEDYQVFYLIDTKEMFAEDFRMIFSREEFNTKTSQFLWGNLTSEQYEEIKELFLEVLKRERTKETYEKILIENIINPYGTFGD